MGHTSTKSRLLHPSSWVTSVMGHFPAGVCMRESSTQVGRALRSPRALFRTQQISTEMRIYHNKIFVTVRRAMG